MCVSGKNGKNFPISGSFRLPHIVSAHHCRGSPTISSTFYSHIYLRWYDKNEIQRKSFCMNIMTEKMKNEESSHLYIIFLYSCLLGLSWGKMTASPYTFNFFQCFRVCHFFLLSYRRPSHRLRRLFSRPCDYWNLLYFIWAYAMQNPKRILDLLRWIFHSPSIPISILCHAIFMIFRISLW